MQVKVSIRDLEELVKKAKETNEYQYGDEFVLIISRNNGMVVNQPCVFRECYGTLLAVFPEFKE